MKRAFYPVLLLMVVFVASPVFGQDKTVSHDDLLGALSGYHDIPGAEYWSQFDAASASSGLMSIVNSVDVPSPMRARALKALTYFKSDDVARHLASIAQNEQMPYIRAAAFSALSQVSSPAEGLQVLKNALGDSDVMVRLTAARALRGMQTEEAAKVIEESLGSETSSTARSIMTNILDQMRE